MIVRKLRLQRGWSQEQLAQFSGLSVRTVQRIERNQGASLESLKSLAAVFEIPFDELQQENEMNVIEDTAVNEEKTIEHVRDLKAFYQHALTYVCVVSGLFVLNVITNPGNLWAVWPAIGWGIGVFFHGINVFELINFFGPRWEKKQIEKRLGRKL